MDKSSTCKSVWDLYFNFIREFGDEHSILTEIALDDLGRIQPEKISRGVNRMRKGQVNIVPGHDGEFGVIDLFEKKIKPEGQDLDEPQLKLF